MAIVIHFPMGSGGNFLRNIFCLSPGFELLGTDRAPILQENKYSFLLNYYQQPVNRSTWLDREWSTRQALYNRYYSSNVPVYWNPEFDLVYDNHGSIDLLDLDRPLQHWNRVHVTGNIIAEQIAPWTLRDCQHIFIEVGDMNDQIDRIYFSKNSNPQSNFQLMSRTWNNRLLVLKQNLSHLTIHVREILYNLGYQTIHDLLQKAGLAVDIDLIKTIHQTWLQSTQEIYYNHYKENIKL